MISSAKDCSTHRLAQFYYTKIPTINETLQPNESS